MQHIVNTRFLGISSMENISYFLVEIDAAAKTNVPGKSHLPEGLLPSRRAKYMPDLRLIDFGCLLSWDGQPQFLWLPVLQFNRILEVDVHKFLRD